MTAQSGLGFSGIVAIQIPDDGATGEVLTKLTPDDYDYDWAAGGAGSAPANATYVVMSLNGILTDERVLTAGADIDIVDGGAGGAVTISVTALAFGDVFKVGTPVDNEIGVWTGDGTIEGDDNLQWDTSLNSGRVEIKCVTNTVNDICLFMIDTDSVLNPLGWQITPGQAGANDGQLLFTSNPAATLANRVLSMLPAPNSSVVAGGAGFAVADNAGFRSETLGALTFYIPRQTTGVDRAWFTFTGDTAGGSASRLQFDSYNFGDSGLQLTASMIVFTVEADYRPLAEFDCSILLKGAHALESGEDGIVRNLVDGIQIQGQGSSRDVTIYDDTHQITLSSQTGTAAWRFHKRFQVGTYVEFHMNSATDDFEITGAGSCDNILWTGYDGLFDIDSDLTVIGIRPSGTVEWDKGADIASAATLTLGSDGNSFTVTGTTTIDAISAKPIGTVIILQFAAAVTLTYDATALDLSGDVDMVTEADDTLGLYCYDGTNWRELFRTDGQNVRASGNIADQAMVRGNGGAKRIQDTGNLIGDDDEIVMAGFIQFPTFTDAELNAIANAVNTTAAKVQGAQAYNSTQDVPVWAVGAADGSVWVDGAGTTVNTPV